MSAYNKNLTIMNDFIVLVFAPFSAIQMDIRLRHQIESRSTGCIVCGICSAILPYVF